MTNAVDANGVPANAIECVVLGGTADTIAQAIWDTKADGISAYGSSTGNGVDSLGNTRVMAFSRPTSLTVYVSLTAVTGAGWGGAASAISESIVEYGDLLGVGATESKYPGFIVYRDVDSAAFSVAGVRDVYDMRIGLSAAPSLTANIAVSTRQIGTWDTSRILVTLV